MQPKFAYPICTPDTRAKGLGWSGDFESICVKLKEIGYDGVELFVRDPRELDAAHIGSVLERHGLIAAAVGTGQVAMEDQACLSLEDAARRDDAIARGKAAVDLASALKTQVNIGKFRGNTGGSAGRQALMDEGIKELAAYALNKDVCIAIEPQCVIGGDNCNTTRQGLAWLKALDMPNLRLMLDTFHMQVADPCMAASFIEAANCNTHVHFADTARNCPGTGSIDFAQVMHVLKALGYDKFISFEIKQTPDSETAARTALRYLKTLTALVYG